MKTTQLSVVKADSESLLRLQVTYKSQNRRQAAVTFRGSAKHSPGTQHHHPIMNNFLRVRAEIDAATSRCQFGLVVTRWSRSAYSYSYAWPGYCLDG